MSQPESATTTARQLLFLEGRASRKLRTTAKLTIDAVGPGGNEAVASASLVSQMTVAVLAVKTSTRAAAAAQFTRSTGLVVTPSGADDTDAAIRAAVAYTKTWRTKLYAGGGGVSAGGGSTDDWHDARVDSHPKIDRITAWEVVSAWNDEHRRNADALPDYRFREQWCAILDNHLCLRCQAMNGRLADAVTGTFAQGWPPLHPDCRCFVITTVI